MIGKIYGTGSYVPENYYDNHDIAKLVDTSDEWIRERTGIVRRHIVSEDTTVSMAVKAAKAALENGEVKAEEVDLILVATITPNHIIPGMACEVQKELGAVNAAGVCKTILIIGSESLSNIVNWEDRGSCILFGDGAGAVVVRAEDGEIKPCVMHSDGLKGEVLACESRHQKNWQEKETLLSMDGKEVFKFAVKKVPEVIAELLEKIAYTEKDIDWFILHQANQRIIESVAKRMKQDIEKFPINISEYGNTSSASIPILLDEMNRSGKLKRGQKLVFAGFGAGLSWGATLVEW